MFSVEGRCGGGGGVISTSGGDNGDGRGGDDRDGGGGGEKSERLGTLHHAKAERERRLTSITVKLYVMDLLGWKSRL